MTHPLRQSADSVCRSGRFSGSLISGNVIPSGRGGSLTSGKLTAGIERPSGIDGTPSGSLTSGKVTSGSLIDERMEEKLTEEAEGKPSTPSPDRTAETAAEISSTAYEINGPTTVLIAAAVAGTFTLPFPGFPRHQAL